MDNYFFTFRNGYAILVERQKNIADAIILAKASAIGKGYEHPKLAHVKVNDKDTIYFCSTCAEEVVQPSKGEDTCYKCLGR